MVFRGFEGINTKPSRPAIEDQQCYILDNFMPLGTSNARTMWGAGPILYTAAAGLSVAYYDFTFLNGTPACLVFLSDGSIIGVNTQTGVATTIAAAGTISNPYVANCANAQFGNQFVIIVANQTNGYFIWDGSVFYKAGTLSPEVAISSGGSGYTSAPTVTAYGGSGSGSAFTATVSNGSVASIVCTNPGSGYTYADDAGLAFTGGGGQTTAVFTCTLTNGVITGTAQVNGGTGYTSTTAVATLGGGGGGANITATVAGGVVTGLTIVSGGKGFVSAPTLVITDANNTGIAVASVPAMPFGIQGSEVECFQSSVWVLNGANVVFSAPASAVNFAAASGGGAFGSTDSYLKSAFSRAFSSSGFLYLLADSSINYISGVNTTASGGSAITTFSNQNVDPQIGTSWSRSVQLFSRSIVFANQFGVHLCAGGSVQKISGPLDGIYLPPGSLGSFEPTSAVASMFGVRVYMLLVPILDLVTNQTAVKLVLFDGEQWFTASQDRVLTQVATQELNSNLVAWGTDGTNIFPLFQTPTTSITKTIQSKLWDGPLLYYRKMSRRLYGAVNYFNEPAGTLSVAVDNGTGQTLVLNSIPLGSLSWTNGSGAPITWTNNSGATITWIAAGIQAFGPIQVAQSGVYLGLTLSTTAADMSVLDITLLEQTYSAGV